MRDGGEVSQPPTQVPITRAEAWAIGIAADELQSYWDVIGQEASLDNEEMPSDRIPKALDLLREVLRRCDEVWS